jgi:hypothetical protein
MKNDHSIMNYAKLAILVALMASMGTSCSTAYDAYGRPRTVVEPGVAVLGAAAAGLAGYAIGNNNRSDNGRHHHSSRRQYSSYSGHRAHSSHYY